MAFQGAQDVAAAVEIQDDTGLIGIGGRRPFCLHAVGADWLDGHVGRQPEGLGAGVGVDAHLCDLGRARPGGDRLAQLGDFRVCHGLSFHFVCNWKDVSGPDDSAAPHDVEFGDQRFDLGTFADRLHFVQRVETVVGGVDGWIGRAPSAHGRRGFEGLRLRRADVASDTSDRTARGLPDQQRPRGRPGRLSRRLRVFAGQLVGRAFLIPVLPVQACLTRTRCASGRRGC